MLYHCPQLCEAVVSCCNPHCCEHYSALDQFCDQLSACLYESASFCIPTVLCTPNRTHLAGWNDSVKLLKCHANFWHKVWCEAGCPPAGVITQIKKTAKSRFKNMRCADLRDVNYTLEEERWLKFLHHIIPKISGVRLRRSTKSLKGKYVFLQLMVCLVTCLSLIFGLISYVTFSALKMSLNEATCMLMLCITSHLVIEQDCLIVPIRKGQKNPSISDIYILLYCTYIKHSILLITIYCLDGFLIGASLYPLFIC